MGLLGVAHLLGVTLSLRLSAFNIQTFGDSKLSNETIASLIVKVGSPGHLAEPKEEFLLFVAYCPNAGFGVG